MTFEDFGIKTFGRTSGKIKVFCPKCHSKRTDKSDKSLSVDIDEGLFNCHYCDFSGSIHSKPYKVYVKPEWKNNTELSERLVKWFEGRGIKQDTLVKMKITEGMEYMPQEQKEMNTIQFNYFHNGELLNTKYRTGKKQFKLYKDAELIPYNIDSIFEKKDCIICEGEIDCLTFIQCGFENTISVPNGAGRNLEYLDRFIETHFEDKDTIYLATDTDTKGLELRTELIRRLGADKCKIITYGEGCKDANELLNKIGGGFTAVREAVANAKDVKLEGIFEVEDLRDELNNLFEDGLKRGELIGLNSIDEYVSWVTGRLCIVTGIPSHGKALDINTDIPTINGFKKMGDMVVGDKVYDENGNICNVTAVTEIMQNRPCYKITFNDGETIIADEQHQWRTDDWKSRRSASNKRRLDLRNANRVVKNNGSDQTDKRTFAKIRTTKDIFETLKVKSDNRVNHSIPLCKPLNNEEKELLIDPYVLGAWLGDGRTNYASITITEMGIADEIRERGYTLREQSEKYQFGIIDGFIGKLRQLDLVGDKHIPKTYLRASYKQRLDLLKGLMDTDGFISKKDSRCEYCTIKKEFADDVYELVTSLGLRATLKEGKATINGRVISPKYRIQFTPTINVFNLERKSQYIKKSVSKMERYIVDCEKIESVPVKCIQVDSPSHLYLCTKSFIPTHNSELLDEVIYRLNLRVKWKVAYFSPENHPKQWHIAKIISKITGKSFNKQYLSQGEYEQARDYMNDNYFFIDPEDSSDLDTILDKAKFLVKRKGIKMLVIDPYNKLEHNMENGMNETQYISKFLDRLTMFAKQNDVLLFLVAHPYKMRKENGKFEVPNLYSISGSAHFYNKTDYGLSVYRNDEMGNVEVHIQKVKFKHLGNTGVGYLRYNLVNGRYIEFNDNPPTWDSNNHLNIRIFNEKLNNDEVQPNLGFDDTYFDDGDLPI